MTVLVLGALTGKRRVAARMSAAALEALGHEVLLLPTMLLSGTYDLGAPACLDATGYIEDALARYAASGIAWDAALIGGVTGLYQAHVLRALIMKCRERGAPVLLDPVLGDGGRAYNTVTEEQERAMRLLAVHADYITPNLTEACILTGTPFEAARGAQGHLLDTLRGVVRGAVVTSAYASAEDPADDARAVIGVDEDGERFSLPFATIPGRHLGTGDLFSALLLDGLLRGRALREAAQRASEGVADAIRGEGIVALPE